MDPPYYDNVMYAELSDFFYVWLKRPRACSSRAFSDYLTDKDHEAVANPAKFKDKRAEQGSSPAATTRNAWPRSSPSAAGSSSRTA